LTTESLLRIGHAIGKVAADRVGEGRRGKALIVRDTRVSGPMISGVLSAALMAHGIDCYYCGVLPTPAASLLVRRRGMDLGIVVSASHNPMEDNGIKMFGPDGCKLTDDMELDIEKWIDRPLAQDVSVTGNDVGRFYSFKEGGDFYMDAMINEFFPNVDLSGMSVVVDCANGSGCRVAPRILAALGADVVAINDEDDGSRINVDAGVAHADLAASRVVEESADIGIILDGDADRVLLVDEKGQVKDGDAILAALAAALPGDSSRLVVATIMSNLGLDVALKAQGVEVIRVGVGDRYVAEGMKQHGAVIGGEQSGHIIFCERDGWFGDGLYTALRVLESVVGNGPVSSVLGGMERFPQVLQNVAVAEKPPISEQAELQEAIRAAQLQLGETGRVLVRYSGTELLIRIMVEGPDAHEIQEIADGLSRILQRSIGA
jgi:phosphoglucosamine mutase